MDTLDYWTPADALAFRCTVAQVGTLKPAAELPGQESGIQDLARAYAPRALRALARIAEDSDTRAGVDAAALLLAYAYPGALTPPKPELSTPETLPPESSMPEWLTPDRLTYQSLKPECLPRQPLLGQTSAPVGTHSHSAGPPVGTHSLSQVSERSLTCGEVSAHSHGSECSLTSRPGEDVAAGGGPRNAARRYKQEP